MSSAFQLRVFCGQLRTRRSWRLAGCFQWRLRWRFPQPTRWRCALRRRLSRRRCPGAQCNAKADLRRRFLHVRLTLAVQQRQDGRDARPPLCPIRSYENRHKAGLPEHIAYPWKTRLTDEKLPGSGYIPQAMTHRHRWNAPISKRRSNFTPKALGTRCNHPRADRSNRTISNTPRRPGTSSAWKCRPKK